MVRKPEERVKGSQRKVWARITGMVRGWGGGLGSVYRRKRLGVSGWWEVSRGLSLGEGAAGGGELW